MRWNDFLNWIDSWAGLPPLSPEERAMQAASRRFREDCKRRGLGEKEALDEFTLRRALVDIRIAASPALLLNPVTADQAVRAAAQPIIDTIKRVDAALGKRLEDAIADLEARDLVTPEAWASHMADPVLHVRSNQPPNDADLAALKV